MQKSTQLQPQPQKILDAIQSQTAQLPNHQVFVLDIVSIRFGGYFTHSIKSNLQSFPLLQMLTLNDCAIKSLDHFPLLPGLLRLDLVFNEITGQSLHNLKGSRHLQTLMLGANKIEKFQHLQQLSNMQQLLQLDLINNPVSKLPGYRERMFKIFPTITILDTLDRAGKDAYANSSMALNASRIPDNLFEKDNPIPMAFPFNNLPAPFQPALNNSTAINKVKRRKSMKLGGSSTANTKSSKSGKMGKLSKVSTIGKTSTRSFLLFPVGRLKRKLKQTMQGTRIQKKSAVFLAAVIQYLSAELVEAAGNVAKKDGRKKITPLEIRKSLKADDELNNLLKGVTILMN